MGEEILASAEEPNLLSCTSATLHMLQHDLAAVKLSHLSKYRSNKIELLPPSSETLFPNRMCRPAKMPRLARPMTTLLSGSMSFTDFISSAGSFPSPPKRRTTFLYISRARNDIFPLL